MDEGAGGGVLHKELYLYLEPVWRSWARMRRQCAEGGHGRDYRRQRAEGSHGHDEYEVKKRKVKKKKKEEKQPRKKEEKQATIVVLHNMFNPSHVNANLTTDPEFYSDPMRM
jgi:hypothetical protein